MNDLTIDFLKEYDSGDLKFNNLQYRKGAKITGSFGLSEGYRFIDNKMIFDTCRIHSGIDRGTKSSSGINTIIAPFDFDKAEFHDYGEDNPYGSVVRLFNYTYGFEMRIMHIFPNELDHQFKYLVANGFKIPRNTLIGKAGDYGKSAGRHTHTELVSLDKSCIVFDDILEAKYREHAFLPYDKDFVIAFYKQQSYWKDERRHSIWKDERRHSIILEDFKQQLEKRHIKDNMLNSFSYHYKDWYSGNKYRTRYSSERLLNGL